MIQELYTMLLSEAESERNKALLSLELLGNKGVGIGDHTTNDFYKNATEALTMLTDADDKIETLEKYFKNKIQING